MKTQQIEVHYIGPLVLFYSPVDCNPAGSNKYCMIPRFMAQEQCAISGWQSPDGFLRLLQHCV